MPKTSFKPLFIYLFACILVCGSVGHSLAKERHEGDSLWNDWNFRISPFFWYIGFKGTIYRPPKPVNYPIPPPPKYEIDVGFKDIKNSIKFALMLAGQYKNKHMVAQFNLSSLILESEAITPYELVLQDNIVRLNYFAGDLGVGYRLLKKPKFEVEPILGLKFLYFKIGLSTKLFGNRDIEGERGNLWVDPVVGINMLYRPSCKFEISGYGDFGPSIFDNIKSYQVIVGANYHFTKTFLVTLGYRAYSVEVPKDEAIFNGLLHGWIMRIGFQF